MRRKITRHPDPKAKELLEIIDQQIRLLSGSKRLFNVDKNPIDDAAALRTIDSEIKSFREIREIVEGHYRFKKRGG